MKSAKIISTIAAASALTAPGMVAAAAPASAVTCGFSVLDGRAYWDNCDTVGRRVRVDVSFESYSYICVGPLRRRDLGFAGGDKGFVRDAVQVGSCPS